MQAAVPESGAASQEVVTTNSEGHFQVCGLLVGLKEALAEPKSTDFASRVLEICKYLKKRDLA
jgi:hypothetical protein